jgi:hypothetical protein
MGLSSTLSPIAPEAAEAEGEEEAEAEAGAEGEEGRGSLAYLE